MPDLSSDPAVDSRLRSANLKLIDRAARGTSAFLTAIPTVCFPGALITDIIYSKSADMQWANFSAWLLLIGTFFGAIAAIAGGILVIRRRGSRRGDIQARFLGSVIVLTLALFNNFVHSRDAWTSVVPAGLTLSALTVLAMMATAACAGTISHRQTALGVS